LAVLSQEHAVCPCASRPAQAIAAVARMHAELLSGASELAGLNLCLWSGCQGADHVAASNTMPHPSIFPHITLARAHTHTCTHTHPHTRARTHTCTCTCTRTHTCTGCRPGPRTHAHTRMHMHTHTHMHRLPPWPAHKGLCSSCRVPMPSRRLRLRRPGHARQRWGRWRRRRGSCGQPAQRRWAARLMGGVGSLLGWASFFLGRLGLAVEVEARQLRAASAAQVRAASV